MSHRRAIPMLLKTLCLLMLLVAPCLAEKVVWKRLTTALLHVDGRAPKIWELYMPAEKKKSHLILVQMGARFLLLDTSAKEVFELEPSTVQRKDGALVWEDKREVPAEAQGAQRLLPTEDWVMKSVGRARQIKMRLKEEGRVIEVQLPQMPDLRGLY